MNQRNFMSLCIRLVLYLLLCSNFDLNSSQIITGNANSTTQTTSFPIGTHVFDIFGGPLEQPTMYIGAGTALADNQYAVARVNTTNNSLQPLAPAFINLNNSAGQANPLCGAQIDFLKLNNDKPIVIKNGDKKVYKYTNVMVTPTLAYCTDPVADTTGAVTNQILALEAASSGLSQTFVACTPAASGSLFGQAGSGIALFEYITGANITPSYVFQNNKQASALDNSSTSIKIGSDVVLANAVDMFWCTDFNRLYVAVQAQAGSNPGDGARSIVVGKIENVAGQSYSTINFMPFLPETAVAGNNQIIATGTAGATVTATKIKIMRTSTLLWYLIVVGGNDTAANTGNQVYALPLVNGDNANLGQLASINQTPTNTYNNKQNLFKNRSLDTPATAPADVPTNTTPGALVGGGPLPLNADEVITDLFASGDSVYASIGTTTNPNATGLFFSQAILDENGFIANWTTWQRAGGATVAMYGAAINSGDGSIWYLTGTNAANVNTINKTVWGTGSKDGLLGGTTTNAGVGLVANLSALFPASNGGLFNLINIPSNYPGLNDISLLIATGSQQIALINPGAAVAGDFSAGLFTSDNDFIPTTTGNPTIMAIKGNVLTDLGPITTAHLATNNAGETWLVVGGANGVAVLQDSGYGWSPAITSLNDLSPSLNFGLLSDYKFVQKIASDDHYLYILTQTKLDRIALNTTNLNPTNIPTIQTIATYQDLVGAVSTDTFYDVTVSGNLALLATSTGLYRVSNGTSIQDSTVSWSQVTVPEQITVPCTKLITISPNGLDSGLINGGNLYILNSYRGLQQATLNRFYVKNDSGNITIEPLPDLYVKNMLSYFLNFGAFKDNFFTNGTLLINSLSKDAEQLTYAHIMSPNLASGSSIVQVKKYYDINLADLKQANFISNILSNSASGALLISGEFGIRVNE